MKMFSEKAAAVLSYMQANVGVDMTAKDIAAAAGVEVKAITGVINGLQRKGLVFREVVEGFDGKLIRLTEAGMSADPYAEKAE